MQEIKIEEVSIKNAIKISPDFIYNRIDFFCTDFILLHITSDISNYYLEIRLNKKYAELGAWMMKISNEELIGIKSYIFQKYTNIEYISFFHMITNSKYITKKFFYVNLPKTYTELENRISSQGKYKMRRKRKKVVLEYGEIDFKEYNNIPEEIILKYFDFKKATHHIDYGLTCKEYIEKYHVSNAYVLYFGGKTAAILLTCEQCPNVYLENITYDRIFAKCSPGELAYDSLLEKLIEKGKTSLFLAGGEYEYKRKYNSQECTVQEGKIYKNTFISIKYNIIDFFYKKIYWRL